MWRWACVCLYSAALSGCGDDACVRKSDCAAGMECRAGRCVLPNRSEGGDGSADSGAVDMPLDEVGHDGAPDAIEDFSPADATDAGLDGGPDA